MNGPNSLHVLVLGTAWTGNGGHTVNRELSAGLAQLGHQVTLRVSGPAGDTLPGVHVQALDPIPGIDARGQLLRTNGLPRNVDILLGAGRFSSGAAGYLRDQFYPQAKVVHFVHAAVDELDRWRGDPDQANEHARTERDLISRADLVVGVGPLLADEARRLARMSENPPPVHELIAGITVKEPPHYYEGQRRLNVLLFGRADDPLKGADTAAYAVGELQRRGIDVQLVVRGGNPKALREQEESLSSMAAMPVKVRPFTGDQRELDSDIRSADLVVIPSRQDGFPLTALEAAGSGIPVLAGSNIGTGMFLSDPARVAPELGLPSVVPMKGNEPARDLGQVWADHAEPLLRDLPGTRQRAMALRDYMAGRYTWAHASAGLVRELESLPSGAVPSAEGRTAVRVGVVSSRVARAKSGTARQSPAAPQPPGPVAPHTQSPGQERKRGRGR